MVGEELIKLAGMFARTLSILRYVVPTAVPLTNTVVVERKFVPVMYASMKNDPWPACVGETETTVGSEAVSILTAAPEDWLVSA